ncbi:hypothetical protein CRG98_014522 [Punica granatum]|uniref:Uncharacterized protein n=1 Tax=Punica granatum TaxID=22663 RepID=A0A2I0KAB0_PUNGR|nr:hypothetical protein CRG98_014522 [Punica granatum]
MGISLLPKSFPSNQVSSLINLRVRVLWTEVQGIIKPTPSKAQFKRKSEGSSFSRPTKTVKSTPLKTSKSPTEVQPGPALRSWRIASQIFKTKDSTSQAAETYDISDSERPENKQDEKETPTKVSSHSAMSSSRAPESKVAPPMVETIVESLWSDVAARSMPTPGIESPRSQLVPNSVRGQTC